MYYFFLALTGCKVQQHIQQTRSQYETAPFEIHLPEYRMISENELGGDVRLVTAAILEKMQKNSNPFKNVVFETAGKHVIAEPDFDFQGFSVKSIVIQDYQVTELAGNDFVCRLQGYINLVDSVNRRTVNFYQAEYRMTSDGISISKSTSFTVPPLFPRVQAFIIEKEKMSLALDSADDFPTLYSQVVSMAHSMTPNQEEIRQRNELKEMSFFERLRNAPKLDRQDNVMIIFALDRITPDAELDSVVTSTLHEKESVIKPNILDFNGWQVTAFGGNFAIDQDVFYAKVYYKPGPGVLPDNKDRVLVGLFTSEKNYGDNLEQTQETQFGQEGPLASGKLLLSTANNNDAALIQARLAELGLYAMKVDGLWGPGSKKALQNFQAANGLQPSGEWDMGTQMKLFAGTGK